MTEMEKIVKELIEVAKKTDSKEIDYIWKMQDGKVATLKFEIMNIK